ncbi:TonB-dependent receptor [Sphingopyxis sp. USTB-05]|uniref:TonB-dependent receptor n=1 Tax=Sphingopyxis sp. USTB-05 TaxID=2830667 RepID=UPI0020789AEE|nr:TonB-dependent receptor [Sphingopyxis sp. USTB-05]USI77621.1 TonB-dependent receptor [Sphingopyxis sp. USTB-05]
MLFRYGNVPERKGKRKRDGGWDPFLAGSFAYGSPTVEIDAQLPLSADKLGVAFGVALSHDEYSDGANGRAFSAAVIPRWRPADGIEVIPFWSMSTLKDEEVASTFTTAGAFVPTNLPRRRYFGQDWAQKDSRNDNFSLISKVRLSDSWSISAGLFRSISKSEENFYQDYLDDSTDGQARAEVTADPGNRSASSSGEIRLTYGWGNGDRRHLVHAAVRARKVQSQYGGAAEPTDLGERKLGDKFPVPRPASLEFGEQDRTEVRQMTLGLSYNGVWRNVGELSLGLQKTDYDKRVDFPGTVPDTRAIDKPWLFNAALAIHAYTAIAVYGSYTCGLEESGTAPGNAANRNEALPAIRTKQIDVGVRLSVAPGLRLLAGAFDITKPYFSTDEDNIFTALGQVRHRGFEISMTANPTKQVSIVAGAVVMDPKVTGEAVELGRVGRRPLGQEKVTFTGDVDYRLPWLDGASLDLSLTWTGRRPSSRDKVVSTDPYLNLDLGARYAFKLGNFPALLRLQLRNLTNSNG